MHCLKKKKKILTAKYEYFAAKEVECNNNPEKLWKRLNILTLEANFQSPFWASFPVTLVKFPAAK